MLGEMWEGRMMGEHGSVERVRGVGERFWEDVRRKARMQEREKVLGAKSYST